MSEYQPVLLQFQALYLQYQIAKRARSAALPLESGDAPRPDLPRDDRKARLG